MYNDIHVYIYIYTQVYYIYNDIYIYIYIYIYTYIHSIRDPARGGAQCPADRVEAAAPPVVHADCSVYSSSSCCSYVSETVGLCEGVLRQSERKGSGRGESGQS